ncbi:conserved hypothetical protein, partial [Perkinsus marinus ATCC 50983]
AYADDLCLWSVGYLQEEADYRLNYNLRLIETWATANGMALSPNKTQLIYFRRCRKRVPHLQTVSLNSEWLTPVNEVRILGITFDCSLTWAAQIEHIRRVVRQRSSVLRRLNATPTKLLRRIYLQFLQWPFTLGCTAWTWNLSKFRWNRLLGCYRMSIKALLGCRTTSSPSLVQRLAQLPPLERLILSRCDKVLECCSRL